MVKNSILNITVAALGFTALAAQPAFAVKNYSFGNAPNQVACSQVAGPNEFKRIAPKDSPTVAVKVCYITNTEAFWPTRYNVNGGYLYLVRGVAYRVKELTESTCSEQRRPRMEMDMKKDEDYYTSSLSEFRAIQVAGETPRIIFRNPCQNQPTELR